MEQISASWEFILNLLQNHSIEVFGKWRHFQIRLLLWEMQVVRYFLCVRILVKNHWTDCWIVTVAYLKSSHQRPSVKKVLLKFCKCYRKASALESLFNKVVGPRTFLKKRLQHRYFPILSNFRNSFEKSICEPLPLYLHL